MLLPIFFPQSVLGLALLLWFNAMGFTLSWQTAVFAHLVWIIPVATLVISIQVYSFDPALEEAAFDLGANRFQVFREVTLPVLLPGIISGCLFSFLLSWGNFPLSLYTTAPTPPSRNTSMPRWWPAIRQACRCSARYRPVGAAVLLLGGYCGLSPCSRKSTMQADNE